MDDSIDALMAELVGFAPAVDIITEYTGGTLYCYGCDGRIYNDSTNNDNQLQSALGTVNEWFIASRKTGLR